MKRVFIVDDNVDKSEDLVIAVGRLFPEAEISKFECLGEFQIEIRRTYEDAILREPDEYLMVLDMQMPFGRGGQVIATAGVEALGTLFRSDLQCPAIIVSSETLDAELVKVAESTYENYKGFVRYSILRDMTSAIAEVLGINNP